MSGLCGFHIEKQLKKPIIVGVDEAGRGPLAGSVFAAAVCFAEKDWDLDSEEMRWIEDSKRIREAKREKLFEWITENAEATAIESVEAKEIDRINILQATFLAARRAVHTLQKKLGAVDMVLFDGNKPIPHLSCPQRTVIKGDQVSKSIAAASILAKVARDRWIREMGKTYPEYAFEKHKGYGTKVHREAILRFGPSPIHRRSFLKNIQKMKTGGVGEDLVESFFKTKNYKIRERNWRLSRHEIDLIVESDAELRFIEVRRRMNERSLEMTFPLSKQEFFKKSAEVYLHRHPHLQKDRDLHFDFVAVNDEQIDARWDVFKW